MISSPLTVRSFHSPEDDVVVDADVDIDVDADFEDDEDEPILASLKHPLARNVSA